MMTGKDISLSHVSNEAVPTARISSPDYVDWHMILDQELDQLSTGEISFFGSLGFVGLGAALGFLLPFMQVLDKIKAEAGPVNLDNAEIVGLLAFPACVVLALVCLSVAACAWWRNRGLVDRIRARKKRDVSTTGGVRAA